MRVARELRMLKEGPSVVGEDWRSVLVDVDEDAKGEGRSMI